MLVKTILNRCHKFKSFVYGDVNFIENNGKLPTIEVQISPRKNSKALCSACLCPGSTYDTSKTARTFEFIPVWGFNVYLVYFMRRLNCTHCGVKIEEVPWAKGKSQLTKVYMQFLANWCRSLSWSEVASRFNTSWDKVFRSLEYIVNWGLDHRSLEGITAIGVDEVSWKKGHKYLTLVYQINKDCVRLLWINKERTQESFSKFFDELGEESCKRIEYVCSDMWRAYLRVIKDRIGHAIHILDRFHIVANLNKALDKVRAEEHRQMKLDGYDPLLANSRWTLLKNPENLSDKQSLKLKDLLTYNLKSVRAWWTNAVVKWMRAGKKGKIPETPAKGYGWKDTPSLNNEIAKKSKNESYETVRKRLKKEYTALLKTIDSLDDHELMDQGVFDWAGEKWPVSRWLSVNTARQYATARKFVKKAVKEAK